MAHKNTGISWTYNWNVTVRKTLKSVCPGLKGHFSGTLLSASSFIYILYLSTAFLSFSTGKLPAATWAIESSSVSKGGFPGGASNKEPVCQYSQIWDTSSIPGLGRSPWKKPWQLTPAFLPGESHGKKSLAVYSLWDHRESDTTDQLTLSLFRSPEIVTTHTFRELEVG